MKADLRIVAVISRAGIIDFSVNSILRRGFKNMGASGIVARTLAIHFMTRV
jgi:hypothetical protein